MIAAFSLALLMVAAPAANPKILWEYKTGG